MASFGVGDFIATTEAANFIPELWSNEVLAAYKENLVLENLVRLMNHVGKKGDTVHIPKPTRGSANDKVSETEVTLNVATHGEVQVVIDKHKEYSVLIEDFASVQMLPSLRRFYTDDAGHAIAKQLDWDLHLLGRSAPSGSVAVGGNVTGTDYGDAVIGSDGSTTWDPAANTNAGNAASLADAGIRRMIRTLDDNDVPVSNRSFIIPPVEKENLLGISRFTEQAFTGETGGGNSIRNGLVGNLYGTPVYVSTNAPNVLDGGASNDQRAGMLLHKDAFVLVRQQMPRSQSQYKQEYLAWLFTTDVIYGTKEVRPEGVVPFIVPA